MMIGGIDLGGTKIEARLFDSDMQECARQRTAAPTESYLALLDGLGAQVHWLQGQGAKLIGLGSAGLIDPALGIILTANLPASGQNLATDLSDMTGCKIALINDGKAFTLTEATVGVGRHKQSIVGIVIGTGVGGGYAVQGRLVPDLNGQQGEFGHLPLPAAWVTAHDAELVQCGCGLVGCFETYLSGPGLVRLARQKTGQTATTHDIVTRPEFSTVRTAWHDLAAELVALLARTIDPEMIVFGGGLGVSDGFAESVKAALDGKLLQGTQPPIIAISQHGDASGALGAAIFAKQEFERAAQ